MFSPFQLTPLQIIEEISSWDPAHVVIVPFSGANENTPPEGKIVSTRHWLGHVISYFQPVLRILQEGARQYGIRCSISTSQTQLDQISAALRAKVVHAFGEAVQFFQRPCRLDERGISVLPSLSQRLQVVRPIRGCYLPERYRQVAAHFATVEESGRLPSTQTRQLLCDQITLIDAELIIRQEFPFEIFFRDYQGELLTQNERALLEGYFNEITTKLQIFSPQAYLQKIRAVTYLIAQAYLQGQESLVLLQSVAAHFMRKLERKDESYHPIVVQRDYVSAQFIASLRSDFEIVLSQQPLVNQSIVLKEEVFSLQSVPATIFHCELQPAGGPLQERKRASRQTRHALLMAFDNPLRLLLWLQRAFLSEENQRRLLPPLRCIYKDSDFRFILVEPFQYTLDQIVWEEIQPNEKEGDPLLDAFARMVREAQLLGCDLPDPRMVGVIVSKGKNKTDSDPLERGQKITFVSLEQINSASDVSLQQQEKASSGLHVLARWVFDQVGGDLKRYRYVLDNAGFRDDEQQKSTDGKNEQEFFKAVMLATLSSSWFSLERLADSHKILSKVVREEARHLSGNFLRLKDTLLRRRGIMGPSRDAFLFSLKEYLRENYLYFFTPRIEDIQF